MLQKVCGACAKKHNIKASGAASIDTCSKCRKHTGVKTIDLFDMDSFLGGLGIKP